ncbi:MAG: DUF5694 domain-containing protein [Acidobacteriota bacterium]|nr:DUF5694 domain-containing protein [Acidobacteriota bacterium]
MLSPRLFVTLATVLVLPAAVPAQPRASAPPVSVMVVGAFHMANPGHDIHNLVVGDVLLPAPQAEIAHITDALAAFHPTKVMAEWPADRATEKYAQYLSGTLPPSRNEVVQLGFRLAKVSGLTHVYGIDADGDFPWNPVQQFAATHGQTSVLDHASRETQSMVEKETATLQTNGIAATLSYLNDPVRLTRDNAFYREMLSVGAGPQQPGVDLLTAWYHRNFLICANLIQNAHPGDRIVVLFGAGHAFLLRQCVTETPGFILVEPNSFIPR